MNEVELAIVEISDLMTSRLSEDSDGVRPDRVCVCVCVAACDPSVWTRGKRQRETTECVGNDRGKRRGHDGNDRGRTNR